jgi:RND family efflux transporter MFP subunit
MQKKKKIILITFIVIFLLILAAGAVYKIISSNSESSKRPAQLTNIIVGKVIRKDIARVENLTGNILSDQQASIYSRVNGNIEKIYVNIGDRVANGQIIALIDTTIYSQNVKLSAASHDQSIANLANAKLAYERNKTLLEQNLISKQEVDNSRTAYEVALSQKNGAAANYTNALTQLSYCKVIAPFSGVITKRFFDPGVYVTATANSPSSILFTLTDIDRLKAKVYIPEKEVPLLDNILDIEVIADALPNNTYNAKLRKVSQSIDLDTRTMECEIDINNTDKLLKPGMFIKINLILEKKYNVHTLPNNVVQADQSGSYIFIVNTDNTVTKKYVQLGVSQDNIYEILSGIDENDDIVFTGQNVLSDGSKIKIAK